MQIDKLSDAELLSKTRAIAKEELRLARELIDHLLEVDARKLFATLGYDSLFKYIVRELGFSESTAYERMRAMRLVRRVPEARESLDSGALSLTTAAQIESFRKQENLSERETVALMGEAAHKSKNEVELLLLSKSPEAVPREKVRQLTSTLQEAKIVLDPQLQALLERFEELHGKQKLSDILTNLLETHLEKHDPLRKAATAKRRVTPARATTRSPSRQSRHIPAEVQRQLHARAQGRCEWKDDQGNRCCSRYRLQKDHYPIPFAHGGPSTLGNLRLVCAAHNARFAVEVFGKAEACAG